VLNKVFDVFPEILIGAAIDVIVNADDSFIADLTGVDSRWGQLVALALVNAAVWVLESATQWGYELAWRTSPSRWSKENRVPRRNVGRRDPFLDLLGLSVLRYGEIVRECRTSKQAQIDARNFVLGSAKRLCDPAGSLEFDGVTLSVLKAQRMG
jgi:hypothetical protein